MENNNFSFPLFLFHSLDIKVISIQSIKIYHLPNTVSTVVAKRRTFYRLKSIIRQQRVATRRAFCKRRKP